MAIVCASRDSNTSSLSPIIVREKLIASISNYAAIAFPNCNTSHVADGAETLANFVIDVAVIIKRNKGERISIHYPCIMNPLSLYVIIITLCKLCASRIIACNQLIKQNSSIKHAAFPTNIFGKFLSLCSKDTVVIRFVSSWIWYNYVIADATGLPINIPPFPSPELLGLGKQERR